MEHIKEWNPSPLFEGASVTDIEACIMLAKIKAKTKQSNASVDLYLQFMHSIFPHAVNLPNSWEEIHKILSKWGSQYRRIDICLCMKHIFCGRLFSY